MRNKYIKYCDVNRIDDGLLREWLTRELYPVAHDEINVVIDKLRAKIEALQNLSVQLEENEIGGV